MSSEGEDTRKRLTARYHRCALPLSSPAPGLRHPDVDPLCPSADPLGPSASAPWWGAGRPAQGGAAQGRLSTPPRSSSTDFSLAPPPPRACSRAALLFSRLLHTPPRRGACPPCAAAPQRCQGVLCRGGALTCAAAPRHRRGALSCAAAVGVCTRRNRKTEIWGKSSEEIRHGGEGNFVASRELPKIFAHAPMPLASARACPETNCGLIIFFLNFK